MSLTASLKQGIVKIRTVQQDRERFETKLIAVGTVTDKEPCMLLGSSHKPFNVLIKH